MASAKYRTPEYRAAKRDADAAQARGEWLTCCETICLKSTRDIAPTDDVDIAHAEELPRQVAKNAPGTQVKLTYLRFRDFDGFHAALREHCDAGDVDFIDGIVHGPDELVLCLGRYVDLVAVDHNPAPPAVAAKG